MTSRFLLVMRILAAASFCVLAISMTPPAVASQVTLQDHQLLAAFDSDSGALRDDPMGGRRPARSTPTSCSPAKGRKTG